VTGEPQGALRCHRKVFLRARGLGGQLRVALSFGSQAREHSALCARHSASVQVPWLGVVVRLFLRLDGACSSVYRMRACPKHAWLLVSVFCCIAHGLDLSVLGSQSEDARRPTPNPLERYGGLDALIAWR